MDKSGRKHFFILLASAFITKQYTHQMDIQPVQNEIIQKKKKKSGVEILVKGLNKMQIDSQLRGHQLTTTDRLINSFVHTSPKIVDVNKFGLMQMSVDETIDLTLFYFKLPRWFTEHFVVEHNTIPTCNADYDTENDVEQHDGKENQATGEVYGCIIVGCGGSDKIVRSLLL